MKLNSTHHDPKGKNSGLLSGSYWRPRKKNYWSWKALGFEPWTLGSKSALPLKPYFPDWFNSHKIFFCIATLFTQDSTQNETTRAVPWCPRAGVYDCCIGAEPTPSHIQSANMINKRMVLLKLNLFILNINSSPFLAMLFLSSPLRRRWQISSYFHCYPP